MNGTITSQNCRIRLRLSAETTHMEQYYAKAVNYTLLITALSFIQVAFRPRCFINSAWHTQAVSSLSSSCRLHRWLNIVGDMFLDSSESLEHVPSAFQVGTCEPWYMVPSSPPPPPLSPAAVPLSLLCGEARQLVIPPHWQRARFLL